MGRPAVYYPLHVETFKRKDGCSNRLLLTRPASVLILDITYRTRISMKTHNNFQAVVRETVHVRGYVVGAISQGLVTILCSNARDGRKNIGILQDVPSRGADWLMFTFMTTHTYARGSSVSKMLRLV